MDENLLSMLKRLGLSQYEALAYLTLLRKGALSSMEIVREAGIPQPRIYDVLRNLEDKGLISSSDGKPRLYTAEDPQVGLKRLVDSIKSRIDETHRAVAPILQDLYRKRESSGEEPLAVWRISSIQAIMDKMKQLISRAEFEVLIAAYKGILDIVSSNLEEAFRRGVSSCLITYERTDPVYIVDEHRVKITRGVVIVISDRSELLFASQMNGSQRPAGYTTGNPDIIRLFTEYFLHNLRDLSKPIYTAYGVTVFERRFVNLVRAIDMIRSLWDRGYNVRVMVEGRYIANGEEATLEGRPVETRYDVYAGIARITLEDPRGRRYAIGGWGATLEDVEAYYVHVRGYK